VPDRTPRLEERRGRIFEQSIPMQGDEINGTKKAKDKGIAKRPNGNQYLPGKPRRKKMKKELADGALKCLFQTSKREDY